MSLVLVRMRRSSMRAPLPRIVISLPIFTAHHFTLRFQRLATIVPLPVDVMDHYIDIQWKLKSAVGVPIGDPSQAAAAAGGGGGGGDDDDDDDDDDVVDMQHPNMELQG